VLLESGGLAARRIHRVTGHADRKLAVANPMAARNNRIEIILLRE
jgi:chemotaxis protein MotB